LGDKRPLKVVFMCENDGWWGLLVGGLGTLQTKGKYKKERPA